MATNPPRSFWKRWSAQQWILAALLGALVIIVVVAGISISLAPAHILFSIAERNVTSKTENGDLYYNFTLVLHNTSGRMSAWYKHLKAEIWYGPTSWVSIDDIKAPERQRPGNETTIPGVEARFLTYNNKQAGKDQVWPDNIVKVEAKVKFRYGLATTVPYTIRVYCRGVKFPKGNANTTVVNCTN